MLPPAEFEQHFADAADRTGDRNSAEHRDAAENGDDEQADAESEPVDEHDFGVRLPLAFLGGAHQPGRRRFDQGVHLGAERAGAFDVLDRVAIVLRRRRELAGGAGIAFDQSGKFLQPRLVGRIVGDPEGGCDIGRRGRLVAIEPPHDAIDLARRDRKANFPGLELHAARMVGGA